MNTDVKARKQVNIDEATEKRLREFADSIGPMTSLNYAINELLDRVKKLG